MIGPVVLEYAVVGPLLQLVSEDVLAPSEADVVAVVILWVSQLAVFAWLCPEVSYRWFDCLMLAVPIVGQLLWAPRILWRIAYLPYRDWRPRPDEDRSCY